MIDRSVIREVVNTVRSIEHAINPTIQDVFTRFDNLIKEIQTDDQLFDKGIKSTGLSITPSYAVSTIQRKIKKNQPFDRVTLRDTGLYYESIEVDAQDDQLIISTNLFYAKFLRDRYGDDVLGLTAENLKELLDQLVIPKLKSNIENIIDRNKL